MTKTAEKDCPYRNAIHNLMCERPKHYWQWCHYITRTANFKKCPYYKIVPYEKKIEEILKEITL